MAVLLDQFLKVSNKLEVQNDTINPHCAHTKLSSALCTSGQYIFSPSCNNTLVMLNFSAQNDEQLLAVEERRGAEWAPGVLDPLLKILSREFIDNADLSVRLHNLFYVSAEQGIELNC